MREILQSKYSPLLDTNKVFFFFFFLSEFSCVYFSTAQGIAHLQQGLVARVEIVQPTIAHLY